MVFKIVVYIAFFSQSKHFWDGACWAGYYVQYITGSRPTPANNIQGLMFYLSCGLCVDCEFLSVVVLFCNVT